MVHWINVNVIQVLEKISIAANGMLPKTSLPDTLLTFRTSAFVSMWSVMGRDIGSGERLFDKPPSH